MIFKNKKGNFADIPEYIYFAVSFFIICLIGFTILGQFNSGIALQNESVVPAQAKTGMSELNDWAPIFYDGAFLLMLILFVGFSIISARFIPSSPKFIYIGIFLLILMPILGMFIENIWEAFSSQIVFTTVLAKMKVLDFIMDNFRFILPLYTTAISIALYTKTEDQL